MSSPNRIGIGPGPYLKDIQVKENTRTGSETERIAEGSYSECFNLRALARAQGASQIAFGPIGDGNWRVQWSFPFGEFGYEPYVPSIHEMEVNVGQIAWYLNPIVRSNLSDAQIEAVARITRDYQGGKYPTTPGDAPTVDAEADLNTATGSNAFALKLFRRVAYQQADSYIQYNTVYRRTLTAATPFQVQASYTGFGKIWTSFEVMAFEGIDPAGWFQLDASMQFLKSRPQVITTAGQKTQVIYTYTEFYAATALYYQAYGGAVLVDA